eukprot:8520499-Ditylum_brightwellii.AAC.1
MILDITDAGSWKLDPFMYEGQKSLLSSNAKLMNVNQDKPGIISWQLWREAMKLWADDETLCQPLGKWYKLGNFLKRTWP